MRGKLLALLTITIILLIITPASVLSILYTTAKTSSTTIKEIHQINVAVYDCGNRNNRPFLNLLDYQWKKHDTSYCFTVTIIDRHDVTGTGENPLLTSNFDVFIIGASVSSYLYDGFNETWRENVRQFVANGGGYLGICGGANAASRGFEQPHTWFHHRINNGVLRIANVYINDDFFEEWQYLIKFGIDAFSWENRQGFPYYVSINTTVEQTPDNAIFATYNKTYRHITYAGGPGIYPAKQKPNTTYGKVIPLLRYNEEPMNTHPIHYWIPTTQGWKIWRNVTTDIKDQYAGVATIYNDSGRIILYGPHPEKHVVRNGSIQEYLGHGIPFMAGPLKHYVFNYFGTLLDEEYNWWIIQRSTAWLANIPQKNLPPTG